MACSGQCAKDYVWGAWKPLADSLKNQSLIIEKLHQKKVFNDSEVSDLEDIPEKCNKNRKILLWVTNKGEDACYEFLEILDGEKKSVLPPDLHTWISYFSFEKESDYSHGPASCHEFRTLLKTKAKQLLGQQWKQHLHFFGGKAQEKFTYVPLVLDTDTDKNKSHNKLTFKSKKSKKPRSKKMRSYIPKDTCRKSPENLLDSQEKSILLVGKPGIGKTTAVKQMLCLWAERQDKNLDFVFYFDKNILMNIPTTCNLENLLLDTLIMSNADLKQKAEEISQHLEDYSEKVTIIFDGISDFHDNSTLLSIINHELLPEAKIVVTCRPEAEDDDFFDWPTCKVYVQGFNEESIYAYFTQMPDQDPDLLNSVVDNPALFSLCHVPMYAFMVAACFSYYMSEGAHKQCTPTELYIRIFRHCIQRHGNKKLGHLDAHIKGCRDMILLLAESAFSTTRLKTINLEFDCSDNSIAGVFLRSVSVPSPAFAETHCAFLHNTMQEFFSALWLLENPQNVDEVLHLCQTEENKHMKYVIPFLCGLQSETNIPLLKCLFPPNQLKGTFDGFFEKVLNTFLHKDPDEEYFVDAVFLCQCLNEFQSSEACLQFLEGVDYNLDLSEQHLDPQQCCAVSYVISQSRDKPVFLDLENSVVSFSGLKTILRHSLNLRDLPTTLCQVWTESLKCEQQSYLINLLQLCENEIYLPFTIQSALLQHAGEIIIQSADQISLHLYCDKDPQLLSDTFCRTIYTWLPSISSVHFISKQNQRESCEEWEKKVRSFKLNLCLQAVLSQKENVQTTVKKVTTHRPDEECDFLLDLYSHVKQYERRVLPALLPVYQSAPAEWIIDLSERNTSLLLEVLKLQTEKKPVKLRGWSYEESEVRSFLHCLPYISQLSFISKQNRRESCEEWEKKVRSFKLNLCLQAVLYQKENVQITVKKVTTHRPDEECDFLLDLYSHVKQCETETGRRVLPALLPVYQSAPAEWIIYLSERNTSLLLEVLKLQTEKKPVKLRGWSDEESDVRSFLQCLPYISQLRFADTQNIEFLVNLLNQAAKSERETGEKTLQLLTSVCTYSPSACKDTDSFRQSDFLLDLYSHVKQYETETGRRVLPALLPVYQSVPAEWVINLSKRNTSLLLEVLKLQTEKKPVELRGWSYEESEVRSFLQCLPYISQLRFSLSNYKFLVDLCYAAAESETQTGQKTLQLLTSVCTYSSFPYGYTHSYEQSDFLLDLYSHVKQYETETGRRVLTALLPVYQSAPAEWIIYLSGRNTSLLLEVLKLQTEKKPVELRGWSDEESEVRSFLQCLPYISQLRFSLSNSKFLVDLCYAAAESETQTGQKTLQLLTSVCTYSSFPYEDTDSYEQSDFLLDLYSHVKQYETETGRRVLPALLPVYQSAPAEWVIYLSERNTSLLLEVLKLQTEKKPVKLRGWSYEESEVRSLLQCLPYISQLRFSLSNNNKEVTKFLVDLCYAAAESETQTGQKTLQLLTSVCTYSSFPYGDTHSYEQSAFLLDLYSHVKQCETETGRRVLSALLPVYQSAPAEWIIDLSERNTSLLLEVLKLQTEKKPVKLRGWSYEESEVRSFLQCLPYISQLRFSLSNYKFLVDLCYAAAESETQTGQKTLQLLTSVCTYSSFPYGDTHSYEQSAFLLDLYSHVKQYETETGRRVLPALLPVYQSAPAEWIINLSKRNTSLLLEVLKLQTEKKPVKLRGWSYEESEVRSFLQCLPYISQLRFSLSNSKFLVDLCYAAAESETQTGQKTLQLLTSVCTYSSFPYGYTHSYEQSAFLLDLYSHVKQYETETGRRVLPALLPVYQSAPAEWIINLPERNTSLLLEVLKLQTEKKPVELRGWSYEESEVRSFLQCLPYISQLRFSLSNYKFLVDLCYAAAESETQTGQKTLQLLTSVCTYSSFPYGDTHSSRQSAFLLDLYSHVKQYETETGRRVLPALLPVYQSAPAEWIIYLSERNTSLLLEVLKLQTEKKPVELRGWSYEESEVRSFLQCLPYISQLRYAESLVPYLSELVVNYAEETELIKNLLAAMKFTLTVNGVLPYEKCSAMGRVLGLSPSLLNLTLMPRALSLRGATLLFRHITHLHKLCLNQDLIRRMARAFKAEGACVPLVIKELSVVLTRIWSAQKLSRVLSSLASLLNLWTVQCLDLTECEMEAPSLIGLMSHPGPLTLRLSKESLQEFAALVFEVKDRKLTCFFLEKVGGDLTSCSIRWEELIYFSQQRVCHVRVNVRKTKITFEHVKQLVPLLNGIHVKRLSSSVLLSIIREIYESGSAHCVSSLLSSIENCINLNGRELDSVHCAALRFTLQHCTTVSLSMLWTSIPDDELECILPLLNRVSHLSVDRLLLLKLLHRCSVSEHQEGAATTVLSGLQNRLDFSCRTALDLTSQTQDDTLHLSSEDCTVIRTVILKAQKHTELILEDCEIQGGGVEVLFSVLHMVRLCCSKALLLQFLDLVHVGGHMFRAVALTNALDGEMDLSRTQLDLQTCRSLALFLEHTEGLSELDLSHCQLSDHCLEQLLPHLHKVTVLDLSHNNISDSSASKIYSNVVISNNTHTVRLFNNRITNTYPFLKDKRFEIW